MASSTEIANLALSHVATGKEIANLDTEKSSEANVCRRFYSQIRDEVLRDFAWPFATKFASLSLVLSEPPEVNGEWGYSYRYPSDCLFFRRIPSGNRNDSRRMRVPYRMGQDSQGQLIYCDVQNATGEYTVRIEDPLRFPPDFVQALALKLAFYIAPRVTAGDPFKMGDRALKLYMMMIETAKASSKNEEQVDEEQDSAFILERS